MPTSKVGAAEMPCRAHEAAAFAAVTAAYGVEDLSLSYVGRMPLAKNYGAFEIYHVDLARPGLA